jgi:DNA-directed RNA polymerase specialized sigma24 family protein
MSHREIAEITGIPLGTVKSHIRSASQQLRATLSPYSEQKDTEKPS